jgi:hypothetical protein
MPVGGYEAVVSLNSPSRVCGRSCSTTATSWQSCHTHKPPPIRPEQHPTAPPHTHLDKDLGDPGRGLSRDGSAIPAPPKAVPSPNRLGLDCRRPLPPHRLALPPGPGGGRRPPTPLRRRRRLQLDDPHEPQTMPQVRRQHGLQAPAAVRPRSSSGPSVLSPRV